MASTNLPDDLRAFVQAELQRGRYRSIEELLTEGLRVLRDHEAFIDEHRDELRRRSRPA